MSKAHREREEIRNDFAEHGAGWRQRVFGIESGRLVACNRLPCSAGRTAGFGQWLYRAPSGHWFLLEEERIWRQVEAAEVPALRAALSFQLERHPEGASGAETLQMRAPSDLTTD